VNPCLIFLHIGRTGGTTLGRVLRANYPSSARFWADDSDLAASMRRLADLGVEERQRLAVVHGHVAFGVHELLDRPARYLTLLRDPVERAISHYHYVCSRPYHRLHAEVSGRKLDLTQYLESGLSLETDNWQTRSLAGDLETPVAQCGQETLERAKRNVAEWFDVVGLLERFDESLVLWRRRYGWRMPLHARRNAGRGRPDASELDEATLAALRGLNQLDLELYAWASERLDAALSAEQGIARELRILRALNAGYAPVAQLQVRAEERVRDLVRKGQARARSSGAATVDAEATAD
jgi:hypothetical protein